MPTLDRTEPYTRTPSYAMSLTGKSIVVIGGTNGIGRAIARHAAHLGAQTTVVGRTFRDADTPRVEFVQGDLSLLATAAALGETLPADADVYLFTAAISPPTTLTRTAEAIELHLATSLLSRVALLRALLPRLNKNCRIFVMSSPGQDAASSPSTLNPSTAAVYAPFDHNDNIIAANEALVLYCRSALQDRPHTLLSGSDVTVLTFGLNPGVISTGLRKTTLGDNMWSDFLESCISTFCMSASDYACNVAVPLLFAPDLSHLNGVLFNQAGDPILPSPSLTCQRAEALVEAACALVDAVVKTPPPQLPNAQWQKHSEVEAPSTPGICSWCMSSRT